MVNSPHVSVVFAASQLFNKCVSISQIGAFSLYRVRYKPPHVSLKIFLCILQVCKFRYFSQFFPMRFPKMFRKNMETETQQEERTGFPEGMFKENVHLKPRRLAFLHKSASAARFKPPYFSPIFFRTCWQRKRKKKNSIICLQHVPLESCAMHLFSATIVIFANR